MILLRERKMPWKALWIVAVLLLVGSIVTLALLSAASRWRPDLGVHDGQLLPCSSLPRCVSTTAGDEQHRIDPISFSDSPEEAWARVQKVMADWPRTRILTVTDTYLHAECATLLFRFLDDVELLLDREAKVIHFRASARVGLGDLGVNRRRMERIRRAFVESEGSSSTR
jgi:uncharacterized protein (DUF1499 family)